MYVLLGSNGNITSKVASLLLARGAAIRVVGRSMKSLCTLGATGADIAVGDLADASFLTQAFAGAQGVYTMIPAGESEPDMVAAQDRRGGAIASAIAASRVRRVVNLSSIGAHLSSGTGPIAGLHRQEQRLNALAADVLHVRPGYFFENHLAAIQMIAAAGFYADMTAPDVPLPMVATADIAEVVTRELLTPSAGGKRVLHLRASSLYTMSESTALIGAAIGKPDLAYVQADSRQGREALMEHGFSASGAAQIEEMSRAFSAGRLNGEYEKGPTEIAPTTLASFVKAVFKPAYAAAARASSAYADEDGSPS